MTGSSARWRPAVALSAPALDAWPPLVWGLVGALACAWMAGHEPNLLEEGIVLHLAQRMVGGEHLFRDLASFTGPLPFELLALLFRWFGDEIAVARGAVVVMQGLACGAVFDLARRARAGAFSHLAAGFVAAAPILLFPLLSLYFYTVTAFHLGLYAAWAGARAGGSASAAARWAFACGVGVALVALCKQNIGAALALSLAPGLAVLAPRDRWLTRLSAFAAGGIAVAAGTLALYGVRGDIEPLTRSLVTLPLSFSASFDAPYPNLWPPGELREDVYLDRARYVPSLYGFKFGVFGRLGFAPSLLTQLLYYLPFAVLLLTALAAYRVHRVSRNPPGSASSDRASHDLPAATIVHTGLLLAMIANLFPRTDWGHLVYVLPACAVQLCLLAGVAGRGRAPTPRPVRVAAALVLGLVVATGSLGQWIRSNAGAAVYGPKLPLAPVSEMLKANALPRLVHYLRRNASPGEPIFVARAEPLIYFATGTTNPTPYSGVIPGIREEQEQRILTSLGDVRFVVMSDIDQPAYLYYSDELPAVWNEFERHYRISRGSPAGWLTLLERGRDRGATAFDLFDRRGEGRRWVRGADRVLSPSAEAAPRLAATLNRRPLSFWTDERGGGIDFDVEVPPDAVFQAGVGLSQTVGLTQRYEHPKNATMSMSIAPAGSGDFRPLASREVLSGTQRGFDWLDLEADLASWSGQRVTLRLELEPRGAAGSARDEGRLAWFGSPRIAIAAADASE